MVDFKKLAEHLDLRRQIEYWNVWTHRALMLLDEYHGDLLMRRDYEHAEIIKKEIEKIEAGVKEEMDKE